MSVFLNSYAEDNRNMKESHIENLANNFEENLNKCHLLYGELAFKTFDDNRKRAKANTALFDAQMISMDKLNPTLETLQKIDKKLVIIKLLELFGKEEFYNTITKATTDKKVVHKRIEDYTEFLNTLL